jgi:hypothetical protein
LRRLSLRLENVLDELFVGRALTIGVRHKINIASKRPLGKIRRYL